ncbi:MAG: hypothetical protein WBX22_10225 [Silvibacterium sp.]
MTKSWVAVSGDTDIQSAVRTYPNSTLTIPDATAGAVIYYTMNGWRTKNGKVNLFSIT